MLVEAPEGEIIEEENRKFWNKKAHQYINLTFLLGLVLPFPSPPKKMGMHLQLSLLNVRKLNIKSCSFMCSKWNKDANNKTANKLRWSFPPSAKNAYHSVYLVDQLF